MYKSKEIHEIYHKKTSTTRKIMRENSFTYRIILGVINKYLRKDENVLDIGCGAGSLSFYISSLGNKVMGIDISEKAIHECNKSANLIGLKNINFLQSEFPNTKIYQQFDMVIFTEVIEHLPKDKIAVKKINSLLKKGGKLILSTPSINAPLHKLGLTKKFDKKVGHLRRYELKALRKLIKDAGFQIIETKKTEGILRNFLFINPIAGKLVKFLNFSGVLSDFTTIVDNVSLALFGESNYIIVARKK